MTASMDINGKNHHSSSHSHHHSSHKERNSNKHEHKSSSKHDKKKDNKKDSRAHRESSRDSRDSWDHVKKSSTSSSCTTVITNPSSAATMTAPTITDMKVKNCRKNPNLRDSVMNCRTESVLSTDSDIRFTRKKLGDNQRCGCALIAGFLITLLLAGTIVYLGYTFLRPEPLPDRIFRARLRVIDGDSWTTELADQNSLRFQHRARDYRERINLVIRRSDLRKAYEGSEILALDGNEDEDMIVHFALHFDPYAGLVSTGDLHSILMDEITAEHPKHFANITIDPNSLQIKEVLGQLDDYVGTSASPLGVQTRNNSNEATTELPPRQCVPLTLKYCKSVGYNMTTYPNYFGHNSIEDVEKDVIAFRELVDAECFRQAYDFICRLLQPPCETHEPLEAMPGAICRQYCQSFWSGCGDRLPERFKPFLDCELFPESTGIQSCHNRPGCAGDLQSNALSSRLCDGIVDCPDLSDEATCTFCPYGAMYCGRGRACIARTMRCDGKLDCPDGSDEKDCLSIAPLVSYLTKPLPVIPHRPKFFSEGFAVFSEKGSTGKLCAEGMENNAYVRNTVAESLCKALGFERVIFSEVRNDTEPDTSYVRVLDPRASEISFVRTSCPKGGALYVSCKNLDCGVQSVAPPSNHAMALSKMANPGDWPWHVALFRAETHVCDGTLISPSWVLTTESCFQGQSKATWMAIFGAVRLSSNAPWSQRRRIIGMVKSPVEGSTAALVRLETPVDYSDFVRPVCLPETGRQNAVNPKNAVQASLSQNRTPHAERFELNGQATKVEGKVKRFKENRQYFNSPFSDESDLTSGDTIKLAKEYSAEFTDESFNIPVAESLSQAAQTYPIPDNSPQTLGYEQRAKLLNGTPYTLPHSMPVGYSSSNSGDNQQWTNCNTLGWSRQRDHLQRVQLKLGDMKACENVSIATVNSLCAETAFHKQDCTEEEFAGSPVICLMPDGRRWALVAMASWRIACAQTGIERPRMYDKITSNAQWIRETINATT